MKVAGRLKNRARLRVEAAARHLLHRTVTEYPPSFRAKLHERRRLREAGLEELTRFDWKPANKELADRVGIRTPRTIVEFDRPEDILWSELPDRCVLKPVTGHSGMAVFLLVRTGDGWFDLSAREPVTTDDVVSAHRRALASSGSRVDEKVLVEELVERADGKLEMPFDWKVYAFYGRVKLVSQTDGSRGRFTTDLRIRMYGPAWRDLGPIRDDRTVDASLPRPVHPDEIIDVAERISLALPTPFIRVDLYEDLEGVLLGEVEPVPGGRQRFAPEWDRRLGEAWEDAVLRCGQASSSTP